MAIVLKQGGLIVQDLQSGQMNRTVGASVGPVAFSSSGDMLAFGGRSIRVLETESLRVVAQVDVMRQARRVESAPTMGSWPSTAFPTAIRAALRSCCGGSQRTCSAMRAG